MHELVIYKADELWLISFTLYSVTLIVVYFDEVLWSKLLNLAEEKYGQNNIPVPNRLHLQSKLLKQDLMKFTETHCKFILEVPSLGGELAVNLQKSSNHPTAQVHQSGFRHQQFLSLLKSVAYYKMNAV